jgi:hypothetical protein
MKKNSPSKRQPSLMTQTSPVALDHAALRAVVGGARDAYFVRVDRETTTQ